MTFRPSIPSKMISIPTNLGLFGIGDSFPGPEPVNTLNKPVTIDSKSSVADWLQSINMEAYTDMFHEKGFKEVTQLEDFSYKVRISFAFLTCKLLIMVYNSNLILVQQHLRELHIGQGHQETIWFELNELRKMLMQNQPSLTREFSDSPSVPSNSACYTFSKYHFKRTISVKNDTDHTYSNKN